MATTITQRAVNVMRKRGAIVLTHKQWGSKQTRLYSARRKDTARGRWGKFSRSASSPCGESRAARERAGSRPSSHDALRGRPALSDRLLLDETRLSCGNVRGTR